jgi:hypothetical protein
LKIENAKLKTKIKYKQMKKTLLLIAVLAISTAAFAQQYQRDVVHLRNGSIIRGVIIEQVPNQSLRIETADGSVFVYSFDEIERITRETAAQMSRNTVRSRSNERIRGYMGIAEASFGIGVGDDSENSFGIAMINGYRFNPHFSIGLGVGLKRYTNSELVTVPLFFDLRTVFTKNDIAPFAAFTAGVQPTLFEKGHQTVGYIMDGRLSFGFQAGVRYRLPDTRMGLNLSIGYEQQHFDIYYPNPVNVYDATSFGSFCIKLAISF